MANPLRAYRLRRLCGCPTMGQVSETYAVGAVAQRLGVATPTLRTWERRYGLGPSVRTPGGHRRYTSADVARLAAMHQLITSGLAPHAAAAAVRAEGVATASRVPSDEFRDVSGVTLDRRIRGLVRAVHDFDALRLEADISRCLRELGVVACWTQVLVPLLELVGQRWEAGTLGVEAEHLASGSVASALLSHAGSPDLGVSGRPCLLLACAEDETHSLPLVALHVALLERGLSSHMLGAAVPGRSLAAAVQRTGPRGVFLWSSRAATADVGAFRSLPVRRPPVRVVLGGPGWDRATREADLPLVRWADSLPAAVAALAAIAA